MITRGLSDFLTLSHFEAWKFYNLIGMGMRLRNNLFRDMTDVVDDDFADNSDADDHVEDDDFDDFTDDADTDDDCSGT